MDIFGVNWEKHAEKIKENWIKKVKQDDLVLLPGDFSWAMYLEDTKKDFEFLNNLPGKKLLLKGNHDYWWNSLEKMKNFLKDNQFENIEFLQNNSFLWENKIIAGTRGWSFQEENAEKTHTKLKILTYDEKIAEINRLIGGSADDEIASMHARKMITEADNYKQTLKDSR